MRNNASVEVQKNRTRYYLELEFSKTTTDDFLTNGRQILEILSQNFA